MNCVDITVFIGLIIDIYVSLYIIIESTTRSFILRGVNE